MAITLLETECACHFLWCLDNVVTLWRRKQQRHTDNVVAELNTAHNHHIGSTKYTRCQAHGFYNQGENLLAHRQKFPCPLPHCELIRTPLSRPSRTKTAARRLSHINLIDDTRIRATHINRICNFHTVHTHRHSIDLTFQNTTRNKQSVSQRASGSNTILPHPRPRVRTFRKEKKLT